MKRRILALVLALGMLFGSTLSVSAAKVTKPVEFKKAESNELYDEAAALAAKDLERVFLVGIGKKSPTSDPFKLLTIK